MSTVPFPSLPSATPRPRRLAPFAMGFRPYFLFALLFAVIGMAGWVGALDAGDR